MRMLIVLTVLTVLGASHAAGVAAQQAPKPLPAIEVAAPKDVADVRAVNDALTALSEKVSACVKAGGAPERCRCSYPAELTSFRKSYEGLIKQHPAWKDQLLSYQYSKKEGRTISGTLVLQNVRRQLETLNCK